MAKALTKSQIMTTLAEKTGLKKKDVVLLVDTLIALAYKRPRTASRFRPGQLVLVNRKARMGRNPATGEVIKIAAKKVLEVPRRQGSQGRSTVIFVQLFVSYTGPTPRGVGPLLWRTPRRKLMP